MSKSQQKWLNNELIGVNSVLYNGSSETITLINFYKMDNGEMLAFPFCDTTINSLEKYNNDIWTEIQEYKSIPYKNDEIINLFKSHGSQGSCVSSKLLLLERVIQLFQYFIAFVRYKLDNFIIFLPNQYYGEEDIAYE